MTNNNDNHEPKFKKGDKVYYLPWWSINSVIVEEYFTGDPGTFWGFESDGEYIELKEKEVIKTKQELIEAFTKYVMEKLE